MQGRLFNLVFSTPLRLFLPVQAIHCIGRGTIPWCRLVCHMLNRFDNNVLCSEDAARTTRNIEEKQKKYKDVMVKRSQFWTPAVLQCIHEHFCVLATSSPLVTLLLSPWIYPAAEQLVYLQRNAIETRKWCRDYGSHIIAKAFQIEKHVQSCVSQPSNALN